MGVKIVRATTADKTAWNAFVDAHADGTVYHLFEWRNVFRDGYGLQSDYLMATRDGVVCGILPLVNAPAFPSGPCRLVSLPYCDFAGVTADERETAEQLCRAARRHSQEGARASVQIRQANAPLAGLAANTSNLLQVHALASSEEELMASFSGNLRRKIRKARKHGISIHHGHERLDAFYAVYRHNMHDLGTPQHTKKFLQSILTHFPALSDVLVAEYQGRTIGGMFLLRYKERVRDPWTSSLRDYNRLYVAYLLYYQALCYGMEHDLKFFDFGRSQYNSGVFRFKAQWGCHVEPLYYHDFSGKNARYADKKAYRILSGIWQKCPYRLTNIVGPYARKYLH